MGDWSKEGREPTPEEWVGWFLNLDRGVQELVAQRLIVNAKMATTCITGRHEEQVAKWRQVRELVRRLG